MKGTPPSDNFWQTRATTAGRPLPKTEHTNRFAYLKTDLVFRKDCRV
jgi:hypothetical protein